MDSVSAVVWLVLLELASGPLELKETVVLSLDDVSELRFSVLAEVTIVEISIDEGVVVVRIEESREDSAEVDVVGFRVGSDTTEVDRCVDRNVD